MSVAHGGLYDGVSAWLSRRWEVRKLDEVGASTRALGRIRVLGRGRFVLGVSTLLDGREVPIELVTQRGGEIRIGDRVRIEGGTSIESACSVVIGDDVRIGRFCKILDNQLHPLRGERHRSAPPSRPVVVEDDVVLEDHVILLPGAHVQRGTTVKAGSVVSRKVPPDVVIGGVTPKVLERKVRPGGSAA